MCRKIFLAFLALAIPIIAADCNGAPTRDSNSSTAAAATMIQDSAARTRMDSLNRLRPDYIVDSILSVDEELRRFKAAVGGLPVSGLVGGASSREALVRRFFDALASRDAAEFRTMQLSAREFADLVYPESPYVKPPYTQPAGLVWSQIQNPSASGLKRLMRRLGGRRLPYNDLRCAQKSDRHGRNLLWTGCTVSMTDSSGTSKRHALFGTIIGRDGRYKFVSYKNEF